MKKYSQLVFSSSRLKAMTDSTLKSPVKSLGNSYTKILPL